MKRAAPLLLILAIAGCGSSSKPTAMGAAPKARSASGGASFEVFHVSQFQSPSGNIGCVIASGYARCDIKRRGWRPPPKPASCPLDFGQGLEVGGAGRGHLVCAGDTALIPGAKRLAYDTESLVGRIECVSRATGMTCTRTNTGHGFFISFASYRTF